MARPAFHTQDGRLSAYSFACGYIERLVRDDTHTSLYQEGGVYHVRQHDHKADGDGRVFWDTFDTLTEARRRYDDAVKVEQ